MATNTLTVNLILRIDTGRVQTTHTNVFIAFTVVYCTNQTMIIDVIVESDYILADMAH